MFFLYFLNGVFENNGIIIIIGHFQVHTFLQIVTGLPICNK